MSTAIIFPLLLAAVTAVSAAPQFAYEDISPIGVGSHVSPTAMNKKAQVVGTSQTGVGESGGFVTGAAGQGSKGVGTLGGPRTTAFGINDFGLIVGSSYLAGNVLRHAYVTRPDGNLKDLGTLGGNSSFAWGINNVGEVVGSSRSDDVDLTYKPFITLPGGDELRPIVLPTGMIGGEALNINERGLVVGYLEAKDSSLSPFVTTAHGIQARSLGTFGGRRGAAQGINRQGQVVGYATDSAEDEFGFITGPNGRGMRKVRSLDNRFSSLAAINSHGTAIGQDFLYLKPSRAVMTLPGQLDLIVLDSLVSVPGGLQDAVSINDAGQITALGNNGHIYLLTPKKD